MTNSRMAMALLAAIAAGFVITLTLPGFNGLVGKDFLRLIALSTVIAFPIAWLAMHHWLQNYTYRISIPHKKARRQGRLFLYHDRPIV